MDKKLHENLIRETEELRKTVAGFSTESIVGSCYLALHPQLGSETENAPKLSSKVKQIFFLLGLMLTTEKPEKGKQFGKSDWKKAAELLESIFNKYFFMFLYSSKENPNLSADLLEKEEVVMKYFLSYFNNGLLASFEQVADRIKLYLFPFDKELKDLMGISASDSFEMAKWIHELLQRQSDEIIDSFQNEFEARQKLIERAGKENWDLDKLREEAQKPNYFPLVKNVFNKIDSNCKVKFEEIKEVFGEEKAFAFWRNFVSSRGEFTNFQYLTERNLAEEKTLFEVQEGVAFCMSVNVLYWAVLRVGEHALLENHKHPYEKKRGKVFDGQVEEAFRNYFPETACFLPNVYETRNLHNEHDLIVIWENNLFVIEAKSTPPKAPFRDAEKAFVRIERDFQSETGIQGAYDQAIRIYRKLKSGETVDLFDEKRNLVETLSSAKINKIYCIVLTRDNFGPLATDLSILLNKKESEPFPWVIDIFSLEAFFDAWKYFKWKPSKFCEYLNQRKGVHGKVVSSEELEVAGFFIRHGTLEYLNKKEVPKIVLDANYSDVFDEIYKTKFGGKAVIYKPTKPFMTDSREILRKAMNNEKFGEEIAPKIKLGVNDPCFCGSGKKYKKCHKGRG
jgi:hypothetical protein